MLRCLFSNHNLIHLLTWNEVVLCNAIFPFFCCAIQNNHLMKVWVSIRCLKLLHPIANEKTHYPNARLHIYFLMTKPKQTCKLKVKWERFTYLHEKTYMVVQKLFSLGIVYQKVYIFIIYSLSCNSCNFPPNKTCLQTGMFTLLFPISKWKLAKR